MLSAALAIVEADGTLPAILLAYEKSLDWLNLLSEPRFEKIMDRDTFMSAEETVAFVLADKIIVNR